MNFYIGDSIEKLNIADSNVEIDDDLYEYVYRNREIFGNGLDTFLGIDQFSDSLIYLKEVRKLQEECEALLISGILKQYQHENEAEAAINELIDICDEAYFRRLGLISIRD